MAIRIECSTGRTNFAQGICVATGKTPTPCVETKEGRAPALSKRFFIYLSVVRGRLKLVDDQGFERD